MKNKNILWASALLSLLVQTSVHAGIYKWVDENGQVHYGERPGNTTSERLTIRKNETTTPRTVKKAKEDSTKQGDDKTPAAGENTDGKPAEPVAEAPLVPVEISRKEKRALCNEAKSDIATISSRGRMREINKKGEYIYLDDKQRLKRLDAAKKKQRKYCR